MKPYSKVILLLLLWSGILSCQAQKRSIEVTDYKKWSTLQNEAISPNGDWIAYNLHYEEAPDTLFVKSMKTGREFIFPDALTVIFSADSRVAAVKLDDGLLLRELHGGKAKLIEKVVQYEFYSKGPYLILLLKDGATEVLQILNYITQEYFEYPNIKAFSISDDGAIAVSTGSKVSIIDPKKQFAETVLFESSSGGFKHFRWSKTGKMLAFLQQLPKDSLTPQNHKIHNYDFEKRKLYTLDAEGNSQLDGQRIMARIGTPALLFTENGKQLFFAAVDSRKPLIAEKVEVWDSATPLEYVPNRYNGDRTYEPKLQRWDFEKGNIKAIGTYNRPKVMLINNSNYALCYNPLQYEPQYAYFAPADIYIKNIQTGTETLLLKKFPIHSSTIGNSPDGRFIHYFSDGNWFVYDIEKAVHIVVSQHAKTQFEHSGKSDRGKIKAFGCAGWSSDSRYLIVYDQYGIWLLSNDGKIAKRLVDGKKDRIRYRVYRKLYENGEKISVDEFRNYSYDLNKGLVLEALGDAMQSGYFVAQSNGSLKKLIYEAAGIDRLLKANDSEDYLCVKQRADLSPELVLLNKVSKSSKTVVSTNTQMQAYKWGSASLIDYKNKAGVTMKGILYKPAGFVAGKKYPMVVLVYEKQSHWLHTYYNPTLYDVAGFAISNYFLDGYLVLLPDIVYEQGNPGLSAVDCVLSAVNTVKQMGIVEDNHIGLIGHSFGGYETSFIITQTNAFAAAVSGSGVMDLIGSYFTHTSIAPRSNAWRYEEQQFRMYHSPFEDWEAYERNSPLKQAANIVTPLLSWVGKEDPNVLWTQSATFHLALRRLGKRNVFLVYNGEEHTIVAPEMQKDISRRTKNWFDYYLKEKKEVFIEGLP